MASRPPQTAPMNRSRSRSSTGSSTSSDVVMLDAPPPTPAHPRSSAPNDVQFLNNESPKDASFSLLLSLPRELRDRIYYYALRSQYSFLWPTAAPAKHQLGISLLRTSRQVHAEAAPMLYTANVFVFTHPSDCTMFRVVASPKYSALITSVYFRIRDRDMRVWTAYLGSKMPERSLKSDLPNLQTLWIFLKCGRMGVPGMLAHIGGHAAHGLLAGPVAAQVHAVQHALGQQIQALQQQMQGLTQATVGAIGAHNGVQQPGNPNITNPPPPPPPHLAPHVPFPQVLLGHPHLHHNNAFAQPHPHPPPAQPHAHGTQNNPPNPSPLAQHLAQQHQHGPFYAAFLRWERELGLENLCLSLQETRPMDAKVKVVCIMRLPKPEVARLYSLHPEELTVDRNGDARTRFRKLHGVEVCLEISGFDVGV